MWILISFICFGLVAWCIIEFIILSRRIHKRNNPTVDRNTKDRLSAVKNGQYIKIKSSTFIWDAVVINNVPSERKMFLKLISGNYSRTTVEKYDSEAFKDFNTLNVVEVESVKPATLITKATSQVTKETISDNYFYNAIFDLYEKAINNKKHEAAAILKEAISKLDEIKT
jgi:hypothetical protein